MEISQCLQIHIPPPPEVLTVMDTLFVKSTIMIDFLRTTTAGHFTRGHTLSPSSEQVISLYLLTSSMYAFHADDLLSA